MPRNTADPGFFTLTAAYARRIGTRLPETAVHAAVGPHHDAGITGHRALRPCRSFPVRPRGRRRHEHAFHGGGRQPPGRAEYRHVCASSSPTWRPGARAAHESRRRRPSGSMDEYRAAVAGVPKGAPLLIGGKSMGGRVASLVADELHAQGRIAGLVCLGYPFHPPKKPDQLRTAHLVDLRCPALIVQGERDPFGTAQRSRGHAAVAGDPLALGRRRRPRSRPPRQLRLHAQGQPGRRGRRDCGLRCELGGHAALEGAMPHAPCRARDAAAPAGAAAA